MNPRQIFVLIVGFLFLGLIGIFPPHSFDGMIGGTGFVPLWKVPSPDSYDEGIRWSLWLQELLSVVVMTITSWLLLRDKNCRVKSITATTAWTLFAVNAIDVALNNDFILNAEIGTFIGEFLATVVLLTAIAFQLIPNFKRVSGRPQ